MPVNNSGDRKKAKKESDTAHIRKTSSRRGVLAATAAGIGLSSISSVGSAKDEVVMVTQRRGDVVVHSKSVPRTWYEYIKKTENAQTMLRDELIQRNDILDVRLSPSQKFVKGKGVNKIEVIRKKTETKNSTVSSQSSTSIPSEYNGIPVGVSAEDNQKIEPLVSQGCHNSNNYDYLYGGIQVVADTNSDGTEDNAGTGTCPVTKDGDEYYLTANHLFNSGLSCEPNGEDSLWQFASNSANRIGKVFEWEGGRDWASIPLSNSSLSPIYTVKNSYWSGYIDSHATKDRCQEIMGNNTTVRKMGITTGETSGTLAHLEATYSDGCIDHGGNGVALDMKVAKGDSGGPVYAQSESSSDNITMITQVSGTPNTLPNDYRCGKLTASRVVGTPMFHLANSHDYIFGFN